MDIGILDQDAILYPDSFYPNLEVMKLSSYHKRKQDIVSLILTSNNLERHSRIIVRKENDDGKYASNLLLRENCTYGGLGFTNGKYIAMDMEIENSSPDFSIYNRYLKTFLKEEKYTEKKKELERLSYARLSTNGVNCDLDINKGLIGPNNGRLLIYDKNAVDLIGVKEKLDGTIGARYIQLLYPQQSNSLDNIINFCSIKRILSQNNIYCIKPLSKKEFKYLCDNSISFSCRPYVLCAHNKDRTHSADFLKIDFINTLNKMIYSVGMGAKVKFIYTKGIKIPDYLALYKYAIDWHNRRFSNITLLEYISRNSQLSRQRLLDFANQSRELKELINIAPKKIFHKGGRWVL